MSEGTAAKPDRAQEKAAARGSQSDPANVPDEVRYSHEALIEGARSLLGVSRHYVVGALVGAERKTLTLDEAAQLVDDFRERPGGTASVEGGS